MFDAGSAAIPVPVYSAIVILPLRARVLVEQPGWQGSYISLIFSSMLFGKRNCDGLYCNAPGGVSGNSYIIASR